MTRRPADHPSRRPAVARTAAGSERAEARLKAERVQDKLRSMPGWKALPGYRAVDRVRELACPQTAAAWAVYVLQAAAMQQQQVGIELNGNHVSVTVRGQAGRRDLLTLDDLEFAKQLG